MRLPEEDEKEEGKKCLSEEGEGGEDENQPTAPDGGWGWCVVLGAFFSIMMVEGVCFSMNTIYLPVLETFHATNSQVSWASSSLAGLYLSVGPFVSVLCGRYGCRKVTVVGSVMAMCGIAFSTQVNSIEMMILTYGVITGVGFGMIYLPSIVSVGYWFNSKRAFTTGIALCGSGVGQFVVPPLTQYLVKEYRWQGANLIIAGLVFNCAVCGMMYFPLHKRKRQKPRPTKVEIERGAIMKALIEEKKRQRTISNGSLDNCIITRDNRLIKLDPKIFEVKRNNSFIARFKRQLGFSSQSLACSNKSLQGIPSIVIDAVQKQQMNSKQLAGSPIYRPNGTRVQQLSQSHLQKRSSLPSGCSPPVNGVPNGILANGNVIHYSINQVDATSAAASALVNGGPSNAMQNGGMPKTRSCDDLPPHGDPWLRMSQEGAIDSHGMSLQQITTSVEVDPPQFVIGDVGAGAPVVTRSASDLPSAPVMCNGLEGSVISIQVIPNGAVGIGNSQQSIRYRSNGSTVSQIPSSQTSFVSSASVLSIHVQESLSELEKMGRQQTVLSKFWYIVCDMLAFKVLLNPVFAILVLSTFLTMLGFLVPYIYLPQMVGDHESSGAFLISIIGISNTVGRVLTGWFADRPWCNTLFLNNVVLLVGGIAIIFSPFVATPVGLSMVAAIFGLAIAVFNSLRSILLVDLLGLQTLTKSFGLLILFQGIATFFSLPIAGFLMDKLGSPNYCMYMAGAFIFCSGLVMFFILCLPSRLKPAKKCKTDYLPKASPPITETFKLESGI